MTAEFDISDLSRRMQGAVATLKHDLGGLRTGRASASLVEPVVVEAYGQSMPINQLATISVPEPRMLSVQVWDKAMVGAVDKAIRNSSLGLRIGQSQACEAARAPCSQGIRYLRQRNRAGAVR